MYYFKQTNSKIFEILHIQIFQKIFIQFQDPESILRKRAERFGIVSESEILKKRAERFNIVSESDVLKKRAERFKNELETPNVKDIKEKGRRVRQQRKFKKRRVNSRRGGNVKRNQMRDRRGPKRLGVLRRKGGFRKTRGTKF